MLLICELNGNLFLVPAGNKIIDPLGISETSVIIDYFKTNLQKRIFNN